MVLAAVIAAVMVWAAAATVLLPERPRVVYARFGREVTVPGGPLPPHDGVDLRHCPRHGTTAHRITGTGADCWTCNPNPEVAA